MPRQRKPTPARSLRAVQGEKPVRKRKSVPPAAVATLVSPAPAPVSFDPTPALELRDTRAFRERVASRRGTIGLLLFRVGQETFAAELGAVEEAVEVPALHGLPEMRSGMLGMFDLRGRLLPVFSASSVLGVPLSHGSAATLVVRAGDRRIGIAVDDVEDVIDADCASLRNVPGMPDPDGVLLAVLQRGTALASVIDAAALVAACIAAAPEAA